MADELQLVIKESGLEQNKVETLLSSFGKYFQEAKVIAQNSREIVVTSEDQVKEMAEARKARIELWKIRCQVENTRKELKEQSLREGKAIDGISNVIKALIVPVEEHLEKQEKFAELLKEKMKAERLTKRIEALSQFVQDVSLYSLAEMSDEAFTKLLDDSKQAFEAQKEAEIKAEKERIEREKKEAIERERMRIENEKLKKEAEIRENKLAEERKKKEKLENELRLKKEAEEKAKREEQEAIDRMAADLQESERQRKLAPDKEKLLELAKVFELVGMPEVKDEKAKQTIQDVVGMVGRLSVFIKKRANNL